MSALSNFPGDKITILCFFLISIPVSLLFCPYLLQFFSTRFSSHFPFFFSRFLDHFSAVLKLASFKINVEIRKDLRSHSFFKKSGVK